MGNLAYEKRLLVCPTLRKPSAEKCKRGQLQQALVGTGHGFLAGFLIDVSPWGIKK